jgi:hypothetical protein
VKPSCCATEMQFLGNGHEISELPEFHALDGIADVE